MKTNHYQKHLTSSVVMVRPFDFGFNEQTGADNKFQNRPNTLDQKNIRSIVMKEFEASIECLASAGVETLLLGKEHTNQCLPDAIFPNNWFSTRSDGCLIIYPMKTENRRDEVQKTQLTNLLNSNGYKIEKIIDLRENLPKNMVLEGTGSLIFHHPSNHLFAAVSERCQEKALATFANDFNYRLVKFTTSSVQGTPIYHTNVLMSCGEDFAVVTKEVISNADQKRVLENLSECVNDVIIISEEQMTRHFCGNILQLEDQNKQPVIALSNSAYSGFNSKQRKILENHGSLAVCAIPTIERIGGGSFRCMLAENFIART